MNFISAADLQLLIDNSPDAITLIGYDGTLLYVSPAVERILDYAPSEFLSFRLIDLVHPDDWGKVSGVFDALLQSPRMQIGLEVRLRHKNNGFYWIEAAGTFLPKTDRGPIFVVNLRDINQRKHLEEAFIKERNLLRALLDNSPDQIYFKDAEGRFVLINQTKARALGLNRPEEAEGKTVFDFYPPQVAQPFREDEKQIRETRQPIHDKIEFHQPFNGPEEWVSTSKTPLIDAQGQVFGLVGISRDITERRKLQETLRKNEQRYRALFENTNDAVFILDLDGRYISVNHRACQVLGYSEEELLSLSFREIVVQDELAAGDNILQILRSGKQPPPFYERRFRRRDGAEVILELNVVLVRDEQGQPLHIQSVGRDVTERRQLMDQLAERERLYRSLAQNLPDAAVLLFDHDLRYLIAEGPALDELGLTSKQMEGKTLFEALPAELVMRLEPAYRAALAGQTVIQDIAFAGHIYDVRIVPMRNEQGDIFAGMVVAVDVTERRNMEEQRIEMAAEVERAKALRQMIGDLSHDFRTPITTLSSTLYLLERTTDPAKRQQRVLQMHRQIGHLMRLVESMLMMVRLEGILDWQVGVVDLNEVARGLYTSAETWAREKQQTVTKQFPPQPLYVEAVIEELTQALTHIIQNAIDYTPEQGHIEIRTYADAQWAVLEVQDNGIGISEKDLPHIFERLYRGDTARSATTGEMGLGLAIAKKVIELLKGQIEVESVVNAGSLFRVKLLLQNRKA